uniref:Putative sodium-coupled neutral amino acid transporter 11 n=1 Tax=Esox lucius TaxID=8010 RepID=A0AAY5KVX3_ESOLU
MNTSIQDSDVRDAQQIENGDGKPLLASQKQVREEEKSSMTSASFNFINSIIGSGVIGLPYSLNQAGLPLGLLLLVLVAFITDYSIILLIKGGNLSGTNSYQSLVRSTFGLTGYLILSLLQFLYPFIVGPGNMLAERHFVIAVSTILFTLPLSLFRNVSKLGKVSLLSMVLTLFILVIVLIRAATLGPKIPPTESAWVFARWNAIQAVGVMSFAFICHHNSFMIYASMKEPSLSNWSRVTHFSVGSALIISALFAAAGYATFTGYTQGDIFENYCRNDDLATFGRFCFCVSIITTFPLECLVTREVVSNVFFNGTLNNYSHVAVTLLLVGTCTALSLAYDCLGIVLVLNGVISATPLIFIIPSACYLKLSTERWFAGENRIPCLLLIAGVFVMITGFVMAVMFPQDCSHGAEMFYCSASNPSSSTSTPTTELLLQNSTEF